MTSDAHSNEPLTLSEPVPAPQRRVPWKPAAAAAAIVVIGLGVLVWAVRPAPAQARTIGPPKAAAVRECKTAIEAEAQRRATSANSGNGAAAAVGGVDIAGPVWAYPAWKVDATIHFTLVSVFGQLQNAVFVQCTARLSGGRVSTSVTNR